MNVIKREYEVEKYDLTSESITKFEIMSNRRQIGEVHVSKIHSVLLKGKNPMGVLIVNDVKGKYRLIDGNHRIEALKRFYGYRKDNKKISVQCILKKYKNLTEDEEKEIYSNEAKRKNESHEDRLNMYKDNMVFWKLTQDITKEFPCKVSIYPNKKSLRFRTILDALCTVKNEMKNGYVPRYLNKEDLINFTMDLSYDDFLLMKKFVRIFQQVFGEIDRDNILLRRQGFLPLFDIFVKNFSTSNDEEIIKRFSLVIGKSDLLMYLNMQGREAQQKIREIMLGYMNHKRTINKLI